VAALYTDREDYLERVRGATRSLVQSGFLLPEDAARAVEKAEILWSWVVGSEG